MQKTFTSLEELHVAERQIIVVLSDDEFDVVEFEVNPAKTRRQKVLGWVQSLFFGGIAGNTAIILQAVETVANYVKERQGKSFLAVPVSKTGAFRFPPGHPRLRETYAAHPADSNIYFPISDFHRSNFESKVSEAIRLLTALGANSIRAEHVKGWKQGFLAKLDVAVDGEGGGGQVSRSSADQASILFQAQLKGTDEPILAPNLAWYHFEPLWQAIAEARLQSGLQNFSLTVNYNDDFGVNAELNANVLSNKLSASSDFTEKVDTTWELKGDFGVQKDAEAVKS